MFLWTNLTTLGTYEMRAQGGSSANPIDWETTGRQAGWHEGRATKSKLHMLDFATIVPSRRFQKREKSKCGGVGLLRRKWPTSNSIWHLPICAVCDT
jgi:hypothetical protein